MSKRSKRQKARGIGPDHGDRNIDPTPGQWPFPMTRQLYQNRYHALLYVFGLSIVLSLSWGFVRWVWLLADTPVSTWGALSAYVMPVFLMVLQLYLCRHYIRAIDDSIEKYVWCCLPFMSLLLFYT